MHLCVHAPAWLCLSVFVLLYYWPSLQYQLWSNNVFIESDIHKKCCECLFLNSSLCFLASVWARMSAVFAMLKWPIITYPDCKAFLNCRPNPKTYTYRYMPHMYASMCVNHYCARSSMRSSRCRNKKSLNQWVEVRGRTCTHTHSVVCICESELSVLLSHTIHHKLLILLDHCRAFCTPRCSLKTQSEANALHPPNTHCSSHSQFLTHTHSQKPWGDGSGLGGPHQSNSISVAWIW